jgi:hypothetical protein
MLIRPDWTLASGAIGFPDLDSFAHSLLSFEESSSIAVFFQVDGIAPLERERGNLVKDTKALQFGALDGKPSMSGVGMKNVS